MSNISRGLAKGTVAVLCTGLLVMLWADRSSGGFGVGIRNLPGRPVILPLDNGSLQNNLPGNTATLPLFLRNGGWFGFGSGAFGQLQANPPAGGVIFAPNQNLGGMGGKLGGGLNGIYGGY
jgi:hypothetical protein